MAATSSLPIKLRWGAPSKGVKSSERTVSVRKQIIHTAEAPQAIGPYSQAVRVGNLVFLSGQIPLDPASGNIVEGDIVVQTRRVMENLGAVLRAAGASFAEVVKTTIYLADLGHFSKMNE